MKIQFASDLHLEFIFNQAYIEKYPLIPEGDILILAGDIIPFNLIDKANNFFDYISNNFLMTYWVPGNHEYYHSDIKQRSGSFEEQIRDNIILINNKSIQQGHYKIIFSTLWTLIGDQSANDIKKGLGDFKEIKDDGLRLRIEKYNSLHKESISFIQKELNDCKKDAKTIVVTHHVPTMINYPSKFSGSLLNEAFVIDLDDLIKDFEPDYWIYGHHHINKKDFHIGKTKLLTNQLGYVDFQEHENFNRARLIK